MLELNTSPNITRFAMMHGVTRDSVVRILKHSFSNHLDVLRTSTAMVDADGVLHLRDGNGETKLNVATIAFPVISRNAALENALGALEPTANDKSDLLLLVDGSDLGEG